MEGEGVSIYIKESIKFRPKDDVPADEHEFVCIEIEPPKSKPFLVIAWYRPPSDPIGSFDKLEKAIAYLDKEDKEMILLGDTNCDFTQVPDGRSLQSNARHMMNIYELFSFRQLVEEPTRGYFGLSNNY